MVSFKQHGLGFDLEEVTDSLAHNHREGNAEMVKGPFEMKGEESRVFCITGT